MRSLPAVLVLVVALAAGCGDTAEKATVQQATVQAAAEVKTVSAEGGDGRVLVPKRPTGKLVLYVHGSGGGEATVLTDPQLSRLFVELLGRGYAVAGGRGAGTAWASDDSVAAYTSLVAKAREVVPVTRVYLLGQSAGGLTSLRLVDSLPGVAAWAGIYPVCNLNTVYELFQDEFDAGFGDGVAAARAAGSPTVPSRIKGLPMAIWASAADTIVPAATNAVLCADRYRAAGANVSLVPTLGEHGHPSNFQPKVLADFFDAAG